MDSRCSSLALCCLCVLVPSSLSAAAEPPPSRSDPYANEPYWYQPGHPSDPATATGLRTAPGFVAERILEVPAEWGSWTALTAGPDGQLLAAAQHLPGIFRISPPDATQPSTKVERLGGAAAGIGWSHGLLHAFGSLYVTVAEENPAGLVTGVYRLRDVDGDGEFETQDRLFQLDGSGEHGPHGIVVAPDGQSLLMIVGNGTRVPDGLPSLVTPVAGADHAMPPGFADGQASAQAWVLSFKPDGSERRIIASGLRNPHDLAVHSSGAVFTFDSDAEWDLGTPWYRPTQIVEIKAGADYGWRDDAAVWPEYFEDTVAPVLRMGPGSPTGLLFGYGASFPPHYQHALFCLDWTFATIHAVFLTPDGSGYTATAEEFVGGPGFPLTDAVIGSDGAMYVIVGGRRLTSALYRIRHAETVRELTQAPSTPTALLSLRRKLENELRQPSLAVAELLDLLGHHDRGVRFAARTALEQRPPALWRQQVLQHLDITARLQGMLALARQDGEREQGLLDALSALDWPELSEEQALLAARVTELAVMHRERAVATPETLRLRQQLQSLFPSASKTLAREVARALALLGETAHVDDALARMAADQGESQAAGAGYFQRNPKYGQAVAEMLLSPPLVERMHHAQMLLWVADRFTPTQRQRYFELIADARLHSKGGYWYGQFWDRITEQALEQSPEDARPRLARLLETPAPANPTNSILPSGPGEDWTVATALRAAESGLKGRDFERGKAMFEATNCRACHRFAGEGGAIGPDLTSVGQRFPMRDLLEAILEPGKAVSDQYQMVIVQLRDGRSLSGRIVSRDQEAIGLAANMMRPGQVERVPFTEIVREQRVELSPMPADLVDGLNAAELLDLLAYLLSGGNRHDPAFAPSGLPAR